MATAPLAETLYNYDPATLALDTETVTIDPDGFGSLPSLTRILDRSNDTLGRESATAVSAVGSGSPEHFINYGYDTSGRLTSVTSPAGTFTYTYTPGSSLIASVTGPAHTVTNTWEPNRDVLDIKENRIPSTTPPISSFNYGVNNIGQRTGVVTTGSAFPSQPADWTWSYDALGQVTSADSPTAGFDRAYEYDQIGNRKKSADGALVTTGSATVYEPNPLNQYDAIGAFAPTYDADGNQKDAQILPLGSSSLVSCVYHWDAENRLVAVKDTNGADIVTYSYDSQSRRVARKESPLPLGEGQDEGAQHTLYLYDGWNCIAEYTLQNSSFKLQTSHTWGLDLSGSTQGAGGVGGLLSVTKHQATNTTHYFPTYDGNGNISEYLSTSGTIAAHYEYDPFGRTVVADGPSTESFEYRFSTKSVEISTGLIYFGFRWYDAHAGRWPNRDVIAEAGGLNTYASNRNNSLDGFDLLGLAMAKSPDGYNYHHWIPTEYNDARILGVPGATLCPGVDHNRYTTKYPGNFSRKYPHHYIHFKIDYGDWMEKAKNEYSRAVFGISAKISSLPLSEKHKCCLFLSELSGLMAFSNTMVYFKFRGLPELPGAGFPPLKSYPWANGHQGWQRINPEETTLDWFEEIDKYCCDFPGPRPRMFPYPYARPVPEKDPRFQMPAPPQSCFPGATHQPCLNPYTPEDVERLQQGLRYGVGGSMVIAGGFVAWPVVVGGRVLFVVTGSSILAN